MSQSNPTPSTLVPPHAWAYLSSAEAGYWRQRGELPAVFLVQSEDSRYCDSCWTNRFFGQAWDVCDKAGRCPCDDTDDDSDDTDDDSDGGGVVLPAPATAGPPP